MAARAGLVSLHFVNTSGAGILVAPFGGTQRRLSANPIAAGVPITGQPPILLDISACTIAEGKIRVALNKGANVPENCLIDAQGQPTTDPKVFYADPPGAILSIAGHKGYGLAVICEILAGALTGGGCSNPKNADKVINGMFSIYLDPAVFEKDPAYSAEIERFIAWVKSSAKATPNGEILMPGEIEERVKAQRTSRWHRTRSDHVAANRRDGESGWREGGVMSPRAQALLSSCPSSAWARRLGSSASRLKREAELPTARAQAELGHEEGGASAREGRRRNLRKGL